MVGDATPASFGDKQVLGSRTQFLAVKGSDSQNRDWLAEHPFCAALDPLQISHVGIMHAESPFEIIRQNQSGTFMLSCFQGSGSILVDGSWQEIKAGEACLLPPFVQNSLRCQEDKPWGFSWVRYLESEAVNPIVSAHSPVSGQLAPFPLRHAIEGLRSEAISNQNPSHMKLWMDLIQTYVHRFAQPYQSDNRLWSIWTEVEKNPGHPWTLAEIADLASVSEEHLRRLCKKELGRSPMQQVTFLRIKRASHLLATTDKKIETIALEVGYKSPFTFSTTFKNWVGWRPSEHRNRSSQSRNTKEIDK